MKFLRLSKYIFPATIFSVATAAVAHAQEINPAPGTYSYGSTSEFSPYMALTQNSNSATLAPTGQSQLIGVVVIGLLVVTAATILYFAFKSHKLQSR